MPLFIFFVVVAEDELNPGDEEVSGDLTDACELPTDGARCRGSKREGHSRVAEGTRLTPEGGYPGRSKQFFRSTHGARTLGI